MIDSFRNIFAIPDLRKRLMFTFSLLAVYRVGCNIPTPGVDLDVLLELMTQLQGSMLGMLNVFTGGSLARAAIFALGIMPYITASIILQLLTVVVPYLEKLQKEGELGRRKITQYTRYGTLLVSVIQSTGIAFAVESTTAPGGAPLVPEPGWGFRLMTVLTLTTGCAFVMWLGEQISERGIGNGISLIIFAGIVIGLPGAIAGLYNLMQTGSLHPVAVALLIVFMVLVTGFIVFMERSQRRIPVQYAKRVVGRRVYGGQNTYLPLKVNTGGVIPGDLRQLGGGGARHVGSDGAGGMDDLRRHRRRHGQRATDLLPALLPDDRLLLVFLCVDHLQPTGYGRKHAQVRRFHSRHPLGTPYGGVHRPYPDPVDADRRHLPGQRLDFAGADDLRLQSVGYSFYR